MAWVTYIEHDGTEHKVDVDNGSSVMQGAVNHSVPGIVADCGGGLSCATCHCYVDAAWVDRIEQPSQLEIDMLECTATEKQRGSRLSCQIAVSDALDGLIVRLPEKQF